MKEIKKELYERGKKKHEGDYMTQCSSSVLLAQSSPPAQFNDPSKLKAFDPDGNKKLNLEKYLLRTKFVWFLALMSPHEFVTITQIKSEEKNLVPLKALKSYEIPKIWPGF